MCEPLLISDPNKEEFRVHKETIEGQPIAVKSAGPGLIEYLKREADIIKTLAQDESIGRHIVELIEYRCGKMYMKYYERGDVCCVGPLSERLSVQMLREILLVLAVMHRQGCLHRDIKPDNILVDDQNGQIVFRLADFGVATWPGQLSNRWVGTKQYWAPEIWSDNKYSEKSDIFALAITCVAARTGMLMDYSTINNWGEVVTELISYGWTNPVIQQLLVCMLADDPCERPTAQQALADVESSVEFDYDGAIWQGCALSSDPKI